MANSEAVSELNQLLEQWSEDNQNDALPTLTRIAELMERETEAYLKMDPDPFDDRHPGRADPDCALGILLKTLFKNDNFMTVLVNSYLLSLSNRELNTAACRLLLDIMPGLETSVVFPETEGLVNRLSEWADKAEEPLRSYATGLLAAAMDIQDVASNYREQNARLVPIMLKRLLELRKVDGFFPDHKDSALKRTADSAPATPSVELIDADKSASSLDSAVLTDLPRRPFAHLNVESLDSSAKRSPGSRDCSPDKFVGSPGFKQGLGRLKSDMSSCWFPLRASGVSSGPPSHHEGSSSSWSEMEPLVIGSHKMWPLTSAMQQRLIIQYLTPMGEYQEMLSTVFELNALEIVFTYVDLKKCTDVRLAFEALKYLASLLCHKKLAIVFINQGGVQKLLEVCRPSVAATGVSMCIYYLAYSYDAMERVCQLPEHVVSDLVRYALWLLECSHESGRCHATMFFSLSFQFRVILELFDQQDGLRKLFNVISTLAILSTEEGATDQMTEDDVYSQRQTVRHVTEALRCYYEAHLVIKVDQVKRQHVRNNPSPIVGASTGHTPVSGFAAPSFRDHKAMKYNNETFVSNVEFLMQEVPAHWQPVEEFMQLGGINILLQLIPASHEWNSACRVASVKCALDVLSVCTVLSRVQVALCNVLTLPSIPFQTPTNPSGIKVLLTAAETDIPDVQRSALNVIINCVCGPEYKFGGGLTRFSTAAAAGARCSVDTPGLFNTPNPPSTNRRRIARRTTGDTADVLARLWKEVRSNNGIMTLLGLLTIKTPITEADSVRALACRALVGLSRCDTVKQIIGKLPLFTSGHLQVLMKEPVLQDKRQEHAKFCRNAMELMERVSGRHLTEAAHVESSMSKINKEEIASQTKIVYKEKELLELIHQHLVSKGCTETAETLRKEATLEVSPVAVTPKTGGDSMRKGSNSGNPRPAKVPRLSSTETDAATASASQATSVASSLMNAMPSVVTTAGSTPVKIAFSRTNSFGNRSQQLVITPTISFAQQPTASSSVSPNQGQLQQHQPQHGKSTALQKSRTSSDDYQQSPVIKRQSLGKHQAVPAISANGLSSTSMARFSCSTGKMSMLYPARRSTVTLDSIVCNYLRTSHMNCPYAVVTCPPFDLFRPHQCPEPKFRRQAPINFTSRLLRRPALPRFGGVDGAKLNRKLIYSRFRPLRLYRDAQDENLFTCCNFSSCGQFIVLGTYGGEMKLINVHTGQEEGSYTCHNTPLTHCQPTRDGKLMLTSSVSSPNSYRRPHTALWSMGDVFEQKFGFEDEFYAEFSKLSQDRIVGTNAELANIYDVHTGQKVSSLKDAIMCNNYTKNRATFHPSDDLVLSDGVLWDIREAPVTPVHKFDKFNSHLSGVFNPNGLEIISNSEIWDLRTFHLLHTVPSLDQCHVKFNSAGDVMFGAMPAPDEDDLFEQLLTDSLIKPFGSSFRIFNSADYGGIATIDIKKNIFDLCTDNTDCYLAIIENQSSRNQTDGIAESTCRLYEIGRLKDEDEDMEDEEDDVMDEEDEDEDDMSDDEGEDEGDDDEDENQGEDNEEVDEEQGEGGEEEQEEGGSGDEEEGSEASSDSYSGSSSSFSMDSDDDRNVLFALNDR